MQKPDKTGGSFTQWAASRLKERNEYLRLLKEIYEALNTQPDDVEGYSIEFENNFNSLLEQIGRVVKDGNE